MLNLFKHLPIPRVGMLKQVQHDDRSLNILIHKKSKINSIK